MSMRLEVVKLKDQIASGGGVADLTEEAIKKQLEELHDAMINVHQLFIVNGTDLDAYVDHYNATHDETYVSENADKELFATLKEAYRDPHSGEIILTMLTKVWVKNVTPTGIVTFAPKSRPNMNCRLYADELTRYRYE